MTVIRKKLIEVALPLDAISDESARRKRKAPLGYPTTLHKWWAQRPLAAARAVIFGQMVDDPSACPLEFPNEESQAKERKRLHELIAQLVLWENTTNETVLQQAREEIRKAWRRACFDNSDDERAAELFNPEILPDFHDPFAGAGSLPLEAQRLGLAVVASDLNPVAVLINKAMIEIAPKFANRHPVNPVSLAGKGSTTSAWKGAAGLAEDVRYYGNWMRDEAENRIGHLYPKVAVTAAMAAERPDLNPYVGRELPVIAWLWARTVKSPNPAYANVDVPLASTFVLSAKPGKEAYVEPVIEGSAYHFTVRIGKPEDSAAAGRGTKSGSSGSSFLCLMSGTPMPFEYLRHEAKAGRMGARLMAMVVDGDRGRLYVSPTPEAEAVALSANPMDAPETDLPAKALGFRVQEYGMTRWRDLFTSRQLVALTTFSDLVKEARERVKLDALATDLRNDGRHLHEGGIGAQAYGDALAVYLSFALSRAADYGSAMATWRPKDGAMRSTLTKQAIPMVWDFAEGSPLADSSSGFGECAKVVASTIQFFWPAAGGTAHQADAASPDESACSSVVVSTDPPYYDNIGYADLSDFFYVWLRRSLKPVFPDLFATLAVPKVEELVATPYRHGGKEKAETFFLDGMTQALRGLAGKAHPAFPITIYYARKQAESDGRDAPSSTGWDTFLAAVIRAGFAITGTWPLRTEGDNRQMGIQANALASSIVLVCRPRASDAHSATRTEFLQELSLAMRDALPALLSGDIGAVDLSQAAIGPGMAVYSKYSGVMRQDGKSVTVREALLDIKGAVDGYRRERSSSFDQKTRFCLDFYDQFGFAETPFGAADDLSRSNNTGVNVLEADHLVEAQRGKAWLVPMNSYPAGIAGLDRRFGGSAWEACMRLATTLEEEGEAATAVLARELGEGVCARARELAVWLYTIAESRRRTQDALAFNALDASWPEIQRLSASMDRGQQGRFA